MDKRILIVDDEPDILKVVSFRLKSKGYDIQTAVDGKEALEKIRKEKPDLILLDLRLPVIDGYEVCKKIKSDDKLKKTPVILLTASGANRIKGKTKQLKADDYLIKPFEPDDLFKKVRKFIG